MAVVVVMALAASSQASHFSSVEGESREGCESWSVSFFLLFLPCLVRERAERCIWSQKGGVFG